MSNLMFACYYAFHRILYAIKKEHLLTCGYQDIQCTNNACDMTFERHQLDNHLELCEHRTVVCLHCDESYIFKNHKVKILLFIHCQNNI